MLGYCRITPLTREYQCHRLCAIYSANTQIPVSVAKHFVSTINPLMSTSPIGWLPRRCGPILTHANFVRVLIINWASGGGKGNLSDCYTTTATIIHHRHLFHHHHHHPRDPQQQPSVREDSPGDLIIFCYFLYTHNQPDPVCNQPIDTEIESLLTTSENIQ